MHQNTAGGTKRYGRRWSVAISVPNGTEGYFRIRTRPRRPISMNPIMEREIRWWIPRLQLGERGAASWPDGGAPRGAGANAARLSPANSRGGLFHSSAAWFFRWPRTLIDGYGLRLGATNGLLSAPARLFFSKHASKRPRAAVLPSSGTRSGAPSPLTSRTSAVRNLSLSARSSKAIVNSASAFASTVR